MSKPKNFRSAIDELENESENNGHGHDLRDRLQQELRRIEEALNKLKPHLNDVKEKVSDEFHSAKTKVEGEVQKNPWAAIGVVALVAFILGLIFSPRGRSRD
jgi:ElaB/YqjD/DUF883 family membrane-anchored ribosome-binding protein